MNPIAPVIEDDSITAELAAIWQRARPTVLARLETIEKAAAALSSDSLSAEERTIAERESHKLAGISGTLGFPQVTTYAREAETLLEGAAALDASQIARLNELVALSRAEFDAAPASPFVSEPGPAIDAASVAGARVALFSVDPALATEWQSLAARHCVEVVPQSVDELSTPGSSSDSYDACVVRVGPATGGVDVVTRVRERYPDAPVTVWTDDESIAHRAECARAGAERIVCGPVGAAGMLHAVHAMVPKLGTHRGVVLAAGLAPSLSADLVALVRASNGLLIEVEPSTILLALKAFPSSVLLMDADAAGANALDVCRAIRADASVLALPIILLTGADSNLGKELQDVGAMELKSASAVDVVARIRPFLGTTAARVGANGAPEEGKTKSDRGMPATTEHVDVAIVDDDELLTSMIVDALTAAGYTHRVITDGVSASALLAGRVAPLTATVILLDLGLPGQDGFSVLRALRQTGVTKTSSVVVLTGRSEQAEVVQALQLGASAYVVKPFVIADLMQRVKSAISRA